ncbi:MAG: CpsD/CapB family tyrosine-protein kinase [Ardenticatenaceae bacterium]|nr:CpsD/CapB family tyrosine-protein kinase [Ardenticatenaceae bacterium]MCB9442668.1 CpsD/CapB family tyrosine-protein kinase [Ardenticatenaceae bacterium]
MRRLIRKNKKLDSVVDDQPISIEDTDGKTVLTIPENVIVDLRKMVTRIDKVDRLPPRLVVTSALTGEGVTFISRALAATISNDLGRKVCIVELNWWSPSSFMEPVEGGLAAVLNDESILEDEIIDTGWKKLSVLPAGVIARQDRPIVARSAKLKETIYQLGERFDHLIIDVPAIRLTSDSIPLSSLGNACCLVIKQGVTTVEDVKQSLDEIDHLSILGVVLNQVHVNTPGKLLDLIPN